MKLDRQKLLLAMAREKIAPPELCTRAGIQTSTFFNIQSGRRNPKPATLGKLAEALRVDPAELVVS